MKLLSGSLPSERSVLRIPLRCIRPNIHQPRRDFCEESIAGLAESIRQHGLLSPLLVRRVAADCYELIAGERRMRALELLERTHADVIVLSAFDRESALLALVENLQRENLHYLDEAEACRRLLDEYSLTQEKLAQSLSLSASALANRLRLLKLPDSVRSILRHSSLGERHGRALLKLGREEDQLRFAREAAATRMSVKQLECAIDRFLRTQDTPPRQNVSRIVRDNRIVINAVLDTVRELKKIGVRADSRVEEHEGCVDVIVTIRTAEPLLKTQTP